MSEDTTKTVWQVSGGPSNRSYIDLLLKHGVALIGPGAIGPWHSDRKDELYEGHFVRHFATEVHVGDIVLLRHGMSAVVAVGLVASDYAYLPQFDDVNGWDLQHARRVRWFKLPHPHDFCAPVFGASPPRLSRVTNSNVVDYARRFINSPPHDWQSATLPSLPPAELLMDDVPPYLMHLVGQVRDLSGLYWDKKNFGDPPTEDETICHFLIPLLGSLGWPPEYVAVKWRDIDVCLFSRLPRLPEHCAFVIEAKRFGEGIEGALGQAKGYLEKLGVVRDIVVTDGIRYRLYQGDRDFEPVAYANLAYLKQSALALFERLRRQ
ncbi:MAG: hypothetical protein P0120_11575 [Nitrospira sp.]|nr:hypothetical protein [Nitrospira sp.]